MKHGRRPPKFHERSDRARLQQPVTRDNLIAGKLDLHRDGYGFVRTGEGSDDIFIPPNEINGAMQGDQVLVDPAPPNRDGRRSGRIARVLTRRNPTVVGIFHNARTYHPTDHRYNPILRGNYVTPLDERMTQPVLIPDGAELPPAGKGTPHRVLGEETKAQEAGWTDLEGLAVDVEITDWPTPSRPARGRVMEVLGPPEAFGVDVESITCRMFFLTTCWRRRGQLRSRPWPRCRRRRWSSAETIAGCPS